ncbi:MULTISPECIES: hypothetical protein [unclassified Shewanella]|uniref:hypothetical protein n=1 Tax=unclassified Shewanella TaxID=196818 RepID=UPI003FA3CD93
MLYEFHDSLLNAHKILEKQVAPNKFDCSLESIAKLSHEVYSHPSIRMLGLADKDNPVCNTEGPTLRLDNYSIHRFSEEYYLVSDLDNNNAHSELLLV